MNINLDTSSSLVGNLLPKIPLVQINQLMQAELQAPRTTPPGDEAFASVLGNAAFALMPSPQQDLSYFSTLLDWWQKTLERLEKNTPSGIDLLHLKTSDQLDCWKRDLTQMSEALKLLKSNDIAALKTLISTGIAKENRFLLPIVFNDSKSGRPQVLGCVFEKCSDGIVRVRLLDKTLGAQSEHPTLKIEGGKVKKSYSDFPLRLRDPKLFNSSNALGDRFLEKIAAMHNNKTTATHSILYGMFHHIIGEAYDADLVTPAGWRNSHLWFSEEMAVTPSHTDDSLKHLMHLGLRDQLISQGKPQDDQIRDLRRFKLSVKIQGWLDVAKDMRSHPDKVYSLDKIRSSLKDFNFSIKKCFDKHWISHEELLFWRELNGEIESLLSQRAHVAAPSPASHASTTAVDASATQIKATLPPLTNPLVFTPVPTKTSAPFTHEAITPCSAKNVLQSLCSYLKSTSALQNNFHVANATIAKLPIDPTFWEKVPPADINETIKLLKQAIRASATTLQDSALNEHFPEIRLMVASSLVIADCLARRLEGDEDLKLQDFALALPPMGETFYYQNGDSEARWKAVQAYLEKQQLHKPHMLLMAPTSADSMLDSDENVFLQQMVLYHRQFGPVNKPEDMCATVVENTYASHNGKLQLTKSEERPLPFKRPEAFADYYYFHTLASKLFQRDVELKPEEYVKLMVSHHTPTTFKEIVATSVSTRISYYADRASHKNERNMTLQLQRLPSTLLLNTLRPKETENAIVIQQEELPYKNPALADNLEIHLSDLKKMAREPTLQISMLIQWCNAHPEATEDSEIQSFIEYLLLRPGSVVNHAAAHPLLYQELTHFIQNRLDASTNKLSSLRSSLFWMRMQLHLLERERPESKDQWLDTNLKVLQDTFKLTQLKLANNEPDNLCQLSCLLSAHAAYFCTRYSEVTATRAKQFLDWQALNAVVKTHQVRVPYWMSVDCIQFLTDPKHSLLLDNLMKEMKEVPELIRILDNTTLRELGPSVSVVTSGTSKYQLHGQGHCLELDLQKNQATFNRQALNFRNVELQNEIINEWYFDKVRCASVERLLKVWTTKSYVIHRVEQKTYTPPHLVGDYVPTIKYFLIHTNEGIFEFQLRPLMLFAQDTKCLVHPKGLLELKPEELQIWEHEPQKPRFHQVENGVYELENGSARFIFRKDQIEILESKKINNQTGWYQKVDPLELVQKTFPDCEFWMKAPGSHVSSPNYIVTLCGIPIAELEQVGDNVQIHRLSKQGKRTGEILVNPEAHSVKFLDRLQSKSRVHVWAKEGQIVRVECTEMGALAFNFNGNAWCCEQMPGWILDESVPQIDLGGFKHGLILKNKNEKRLLLPCKSIKNVTPLEKTYEMDELPVGGLGQTDC